MLAALSAFCALVPVEAAYATLVESVDNALGDIVDALKKTNQLQHTIIVFKSDNGGYSAGARGRFPNLHNLPLRSGKGSCCEGGTRVPFVIAGPGIQIRTSLTKRWITSADLFATIAELAGLTADSPDGISFTSAITTGVDEDRASANLWHYPHARGESGPGMEPHTAIRGGAFKAIFFYGSKRWELYNLGADLGETRDVSRRQPAKLRELALLMNRELTRMDAQVPIDASTGKPIWPTVPAGS